MHLHKTYVFELQSTVAKYIYDFKTICQSCLMLLHMKEHDFRRHGFEIIDVFGYYNTVSEF